jgi:hypothetical protein
MQLAKSLCSFWFGFFRELAMIDVIVRLDDALFQKASRSARLENLSIEDLLESALRRHVEHAEAAEEFSRMAPFSPNDYELQRDPTKATMTSHFEGPYFSKPAYAH